MKIAGVLPLAFLLASTSANSQQSVTLAAPSTLSQTRPVALSNCPVGLDVRHESLTARRVVNEAKPGPDRDMADPFTGQRVVLSFDNLRSRDIVHIRMTARGLSQKGRYVPLAGDSSAADLSKSIELAIPVKAQGHASRDLELDRFAAVTAIEVDAVTYADGSRWQTLVPGACSASPNMMMLLSAAK